MNEILETITPDTIFRNIGGNLHDLFIFFAQKGNRTFSITGDVSWVTTKPSLWPNAIFGAQIKSNTTESRIIQIISEIEADRMPSVWVVGPGSEPDDLGDQLERKGFTKKGTQIGMAADLAALPEGHTPTNSSIHIVTDRTMLRTWAATVEEGLFGQKIFDPLLLEALLHEPAAAFYLGIYNEKPIATSFLFLSSGVAGLYLVSTLPQYRRRGMGTAMTLKPLLDARDAGYNIGILQANPSAENMYAQIGFNTYCTFDFLKWEIE